MPKTPPKSVAHATKPRKPYPEFPLYPHASGQWAKKVRVGGASKTKYFGSWDDPDAAIQRYKAEIDDLRAGREVQRADGLTVAALIDAFMAKKRALVYAGELSPHTLAIYEGACHVVKEVFGSGAKVQGLRPIDFEKLRERFSKTHGPVRLGTDVTLVKTLFKYADDVFDVRVKWGDGFCKPAKHVLRKLKQKQPKRFFEASEIRLILDTLAKDRKVKVSREGEMVESVRLASPALRAMVLLGVNAGLGNEDVDLLTFDRIDLKGGWLDYPRSKTGVPRRAKLFPETVAAVKAAIGARPEPKDAAHKNRVFITRKGGAWGPSVKNEFGRVIRELGLDRRGRGFYSCRHVANTISLQVRDREATRRMMGHAGEDMTENYDQIGVTDARLKAIAAHLRRWLFAKAATE